MGLDAPARACPRRGATRGIRASRSPPFECEMGLRDRGALGARGRMARVVHGLGRPGLPVRDQRRAPERDRAAVDRQPRPALRRAARRQVALPRLDLDRLVREARLQFDLPDETEELLASLPPRADLKAGVAGYPAVDRSRKGDPIVNLRPTLSRRGTDLRRSGNAGASRMLFGANEHDLASPFIAGGADALDLSAEPGFTPWQGPDPTTTRQATSIQSPAAAAGGATASSRGAVTPSAGGATPAVPRAVALSSTTPAPGTRSRSRSRRRRSRFRPAA